MEQIWIISDLAKPAHLTAALESKNELVRASASREIARREALPPKEPYIRGKKPLEASKSPESSLMGCLMVG
jgi:hypothetical protein